MELPVLVVGGGPVGLTASILLSQYGVRSLLVLHLKEVWGVPAPVSAG